MFTLKEILIRTGWVLLGILLVVYVVHQGWAFITGPCITLEGPGDGAVFDDPVIHVFGTATHTTYITLDGRPIFIDERGEFNEMLVLSPGNNIVTLYARDRFGHEVTEMREVVYKTDKTSCQLSVVGCQNEEKITTELPDSQDEQPTEPQSGDNGSQLSE
jgi:hypothetical protein